MNLNQTLGTKEWDELEQLRGRDQMKLLSSWISEHVRGLPLRWLAQEGDEAIIVRTATISTSGHLVLEFRQVRVTGPKHVEPLSGWEVLGFEMLRPPPFWVQPKLAFDATRPRATDSVGDPRPRSADGEGQGPTPGSGDVPGSARSASDS